MHTKSILVAATAIAASPTIWNIVARNEYRNKTISKLVGSNVTGAYLMAAWIFFSSLGRDKLFDEAMQKNAAAVLTKDAGAAKVLAAAGYAMFTGGSVLVLSAYYRLGITGTYLGDYFGILMRERVTAFPFSHFDNPMYNGATMCFLGMALRANSLVGVGLSAWVYAVYQASSLRYENPFTTMIYEEAAAKKRSE
jgi:phosphatidylethanolamine/phosphatidyl-N-methylethanolamine N-methyltransferase